MPLRSALRPTGLPILAQGRVYCQSNAPGVAGHALSETVKMPRCDRLPHGPAMSNRAKWAHRNRAKSGSDLARIPVGLAILGLGSVLLFGGLEGMRAHMLMFPAFDFRLGTFVIGQTIGLLVLGVGFIVAGIAILVVRH